MSSTSDGPGRLGSLVAPARRTAMSVSKRVWAEALWARVAARRATGQRLGRGAPTRPPRGTSSGVLQNEAEWAAATAELRALGLPRHPDGSKNWDTCGALAAVLSQTTPDARVLDAGAARYSTFLPALRLYGYANLVGTNLEFSRRVHYGPVEFEYDDVERSHFADASFDAIACLSVIEHGVDVDRYLSEAARLLKPGGVLVTSTDYWCEAVDTTGKTAYGTQVRIFTRADIEQLLNRAHELGLEPLDGPPELECDQRAVRWKRLDLRYTYVLLTLVRKG